MIEILAIFIGYFLGSINPAFIFGKALKGIDIREHGTKNAGTTNVKKTLGIGPAILTAIFDLSKGLLAIWIASLFGLPPFWVYCAGIAAILGHIFPFYLGFRGGQGTATAVGMMFYYAYKLAATSSVDWRTFLFGVISIIIALFIVLYVMRSEKLLGLIVLPPLIVSIIACFEPNIYYYFLIILICFIIFNNILVLFQQQILPTNIPKDKIEHLYSWRSLLRPLAVLFVIFIYVLPENIVLYIIGALALIFIVFDLLRLLIKNVNAKIFTYWRGFLKQKDKQKFSSMTLFMTAVFLIYLLFPTQIASISILFLILVIWHQNSSAFFTAE